MIAICPSEAQLRSLSLGELSEEKSDELLSHLQNCETCQAEIATLDAVEDTFVGQLKVASQFEADNFGSESECRAATARALGALALLDTNVGGPGMANVPRLIGEYEMIRPLGNGGMGHVFLGRHTKLGRSVAVKLIAHHRRWDKTMQDRFAAEMRMIGALNHPNIVVAHDARDVDDVAVLVTEFIDGMDAGDIVKRNGRLNVADACAIVIQVGKALDYIDTQGLVHRDIKPSNVMVARDGVVKLLDLGLARLQVSGDERGEFTATGQAIGTADYVAPEQIKDGRNIDIHTDIYGLGCTLYKLLCGQAPFAGTNHATVFSKLNAHVAELPRPIGGLRDDVPPEVADVVHEMLAKAPADRPKSGQEVIDRLSPFADRADLPSLVESSLKLPPDGKLTHSVQSKPSKSKPNTKSFLSQRVRVLTAIAAAIVSLVFGLWMGITITVKKSDGTQATVEIPDGSTAIVDSEGNIEIQLAGDAGQVTIPKKDVQIHRFPEDAASGPSESDTALSQSYQHSFQIGPESLLCDRVEPYDFIDLYAVTQDGAAHDYPVFFGGRDLRRKRIATKKQITAMNSTGAGKTIFLELDKQEHEAFIAARRFGFAINVEFHDAARDLVEDRARMSGVWRTVMQRTDGKVTEHNVEDTMLIVRDQAIMFRGGKWHRFKMDLSHRNGLSVITLLDPQGENETVVDRAIYQFLPNGRLEIGFADDSREIVAEFENAKHFYRLEKVKTPQTESQKQAVTIRRSAEQADVKFELYLAEERHDEKETVGLGISSATSERRTVKPAMVEESGEKIWLRGESIVTNADVLEATFDPDAPHGLMVFMKLTDQAADRVYLATRNNIGALIAVVIDGKVVCAPQIQSPMKSELAISGNFSKEQAKRISIGIVPKVKLPEGVDGDQASIRTNSINNLRRIMLAMHNYHDSHRHFPAATHQPDEESPGLSWRVALLPFLGYAELYEEFRFNEPWDSEHNKQLLDRMPKEYRHPADAADSIVTRYVAFVGEEAVLTKNTPRKISEILDGTSNTIMLVEVADGIPWTKPEDIEFDSGKPVEIHNDTAGGLVVAFADGSVRFFADEWTTPQNLKIWITPSGGEVMDFEKRSDLPNASSK